MSMEEYKKALKMGQKNFRACVSKGQYPYLQVLDAILEHTEVGSTVPLGLVDIPMDFIVARPRWTRASGTRSSPTNS